MNCFMDTKTRQCRPINKDWDTRFVTLTRPTMLQLVNDVPLVKSKNKVVRTFWNTSPIRSWRSFSFVRLQWLPIKMVEEVGVGTRVSGPGRTKPTEESSNTRGLRTETVDKKRLKSVKGGKCRTPRDLYETWRIVSTVVRTTRETNFSRRWERSERTIYLEMSKEFWVELKERENIAGGF